MTFLVFPTTARFRKFVLSYPVLLLHQKAGPVPVKKRCHNNVDMKTKSWAVWQNIRTHTGKQSLIVFYGSYMRSDLGGLLLRTTLTECHCLMIVTNTSVFFSDRMETLSLIVSNWNLHLNSSSPFSYAWDALLEKPFKSRKGRKKKRDRLSSLAVHKRKCSLTTRHVNSILLVSFLSSTRTEPAAEIWCCTLAYVIQTLQCSPPIIGNSYQLRLLPEVLVSNADPCVVIIPWIKVDSTFSKQAKGEVKILMSPIPPKNVINKT